MKYFQTEGWMKITFPLTHLQCQSANWKKSHENWMIHVPHLSFEKMEKKKYFSWVLKWKMFSTKWNKLCYVESICSLSSSSNTQNFLCSMIIHLTLCCYEHKFPNHKKILFLPLQNIAAAHAKFLFLTSLETTFVQFSLFFTSDNVRRHAQRERKMKKASLLY